MYKGVCSGIVPSLFSDEGHETLAETLITIKTLVVVVNVWSKNLDYGHEAVRDINQADKT